MPQRIAAFAFVLIPVAAFGADWPQWRGPDRTNISPEKGLLKSWPADGPKLLWSAKDCGLAYSTVAVVGDTLFSMGADDKANTEFVFARNVNDGKEKWRTGVDKYYNNGWGGGPRSTPTVDAGSVYVITGNGTIACLNAEKGTQVWAKSMEKDLGGKKPNWGYCESPTVDGDNVICTPGGDKGTLAALDKKSGEVKWRSKNLTDPAAYSSIVIRTIEGVKQYITMSPKGIVSVAAEDGKFLWRSELGKNGTAVIPTPVVKDNAVFATSGYQAVCGMTRVTKDGTTFTPEDQYDNRDLVNHHGGVILLGDHIYGHSNTKGWVCMEFATGKVAWNNNQFPKGSIACADGSFYCYSEKDGTVAKIEATPTAWKEQGRFKIPEVSPIRSKKGGVWAHPVISNGRLYLRDQELLFCFDLRDNES